MADRISVIVESNRQELLKRLPKYLSPDQFFRLCFQLSRERKIKEVAEHNPDSVLNCIFQAADCGLVIGGPFGHCFVVPFGQSVQLIVGWKGLVYQWLTAGAVLKAVSNVVYVGDDIEVVGGDEERISHKPSLTDPNRFDPKWMNDPQNILGSYAVAWLPDKSLRLKMYRWCSRGVIEQARNSSTNATGPAWREHYAAMAAKTAIRRLDGLIQKCGTTPENREAWDRYSRTIELDNKSYNRFEDHDDDSPDDLPITSVGKVSPTSGAAVEVSAERGKIYPPPQGRKQRAVAPPPPQPPPDPEPEPEEPAPEVPISQEEADTLVKFAGAAGLSFSKLQEHIQEQYHVALMGLTNTQFSELMVEFRKGPAATQP